MISLLSLDTIFGCALCNISISATLSLIWYQIFYIVLFSLKKTGLFVLKLVCVLCFMCSFGFWKVLTNFVSCFFVIGKIVMDVVCVSPCKYHPLHIHLYAKVYLCASVLRFGECGY